MKRARDELMAKGVKPQEEEQEGQEMKRKKVEEAKVKYIEGRTEKHVECMEEKVLEKIHKIETTRVQPIVHRDRYQVPSTARHDTTRAHGM